MYYREGIAIVYEEEEALLIEICNKHQIDPNILKELFKVEKEFADRNLSRRVGIHNKLSEKILESLNK